MSTSAIHFRLPWPDRVLSPNARTHWSRKARATKASRNTACLSVLHQTYADDRAKLAGQRLRVDVTFVPRTAARRDLDNLIASMKASHDGIADALGVDDSKFELLARIGKKDQDGPYVTVKVEVCETITETKGEG